MVACLLQCSPTYSPATMPAEYIAFGSGGGFTGQEKGMYLLPNGQLFQIRGLQRDTTELEKIKKSKAKQLWTAVEDILANHPNISQPGNRYYFLRLKSDSLQRAASWGATDYTPPSELTDIFEELNKFAVPVVTKPGE